jgi:serine protease AprX
MAKRAAKQFLVIPARLVDLVLLGPTDDRRQLQDSPILGDVWLEYGAHPGKVQDLLITPHRKTVAPVVAKAIADRLAGHSAAEGKSAQIAYLQGLVAARLTLTTLLSVVVPLTDWWGSRKIAKALTEYNETKLQGHLRQVFGSLLASQPGQDKPEGTRRYEFFSPLDRYLSLSGLLLWAAQKEVSRRQPVEITDILQLAISNVKAIAKKLTDLYELLPEDSEPPEMVFQVSLNRRVAPALERSVAAVKGDAARSLFKVETRKIAWAVIDSGIDSTHKAFLDSEDPDARTRVVKALDFTRVRRICTIEKMPADQQKALAAELKVPVAQVKTWLDQLHQDAVEGRPTNWDIAEKLLAASSPTPQISHGTHVAGIIGARRHGERFRDGMCPDIQLYDFRVLDDDAKNTEFAIIGALQYIRYVNERHSHTTIHGANLSLSIPHNVRNYACGRTPVCIECQRLVESGVVVVAAAGNRGYQRFETKDGPFEGYAAFSITDPGNAEDVITVGATHGNWPHTYGVSYFSSRGPTGDGRMKPDLVAPGERIEAPLPNDDVGAESGTSMAAPHVSGAAAMLMARYPELIGNPRRIKRILCESATDLARERSFQGHGMLDVLRAFQSI